MLSLILGNIIGCLLILLIIWWFWLYKTQKIDLVSGLLEIKVKDGVYQPAVFKIKANKPITLRFIREDATPCSEYVIFDKLNISRKLPLNQPTDVNITPQKSGQYEFTCQMGMYKGKIIAV
jgi:plastocyanin domain-containing protein